MRPESASPQCAALQRTSDDNDDLRSRNGCASWSKHATSTARPAWPVDLDPQAGKEDINGAEHLSQVSTRHLIDLEKICEHDVTLPNFFHWFETQVLAQAQNRGSILIWLIAFRKWISRVGISVLIAAISWIGVGVIGDRFFPEENTTR